ncbi:DUF389 domain-containing protein [Leptolyngbya sp. AN02str]|uniref:DUF389 domain-containing protein n=1 Tax=Leptolyngbya sp. AN02str TaxID=3423363 RepID=UPI003D30F5B4
MFGTEKRLHRLSTSNIHPCEIPSLPMLKRFIHWITKKLSELRNGNSGDWAWLNSKPMPLPAMNRHLWRSADPSITYYLLLTLSVIIATFGLLSNSAAVIIGAMIIAPLMGPISGIAFSIVLNNRRLLRRSMLGLITGCTLAIATATAISLSVGIQTPTAEILARVRPNLMDLGVALAAGTAGAYASSRRDIANALPGVAIAVALVPPLGVVGYGVALSSQSITGGALLLFATNLAAIIFSGSVVFLFQRYGSIARAQRGLTIAVTALILLGIPLAFSFQDLVLRERTRTEINRLIRRRTLTFADRSIRTLNVDRIGRELYVDLEVAAPPNTVTEKQVQLVQDFLQRQLDRPIYLNVTVVPVEIFVAPAN